MIPVSTTAVRLHSKRLDAILAALAGAVRAGYWLLFQRHYAPMSDANHYDGIARNLAAGRGFAHQYPQLVIHATAFRPPVYPSLLGAVYALTGSRVFFGLCLNLLLGVVVVLLTRRVGSAIGGEPAGIAAAAVVAVYPPLVANDVALLTEPLGLCLLLGVILCLVRQRLWWAGVLSGLLCLTWTAGQGFLVVVTIWLCVRVGWRKALRVAAIAAAVTAPWIIRNELQVGTPLLVTSDGFNLAAVYSPQAQQARVLFIDPTFNASFDTWQYRLAQFHEARWDSLLRHTAWQGLRADPARVLHVAADNSLRFFEVEQTLNGRADVADGRSRTVRHYGMPVFYVVTLAGLTGLWWFRRSPVVRLVALFAAYFGVASILTVFSPRLRSVFDLTCCLAAGALVAEFVMLRRRRLSP